MAKPTPNPEARGSWATLFNQTTDAVFLLNPRRRVRYVNRAFEALTRTHADDVVHEYCHPKKIQKDLPATRRALLQTLAPPREAARRIVQVRRPVPPAKLGPPWWDITFIPLREGDKLVAMLGWLGAAEPLPATAGVKTLPEALMALRQPAIERVPLALFAGDSPGARRLYAQAEHAAQHFSPVWIHGETGVGKETLARAIHFHGVTRERSFAAIDCAGLQPYLIRSMLFGHNGLAESGCMGTIYLKSPAALPTDLQEELSAWAGHVSASCRVIVGASAADTVVPELHATFAVLELHLPPLRKRSAELPAILARLVANEDIAGMTTAAAAVFLNYSWPGNVRELRDVLRSAAKRAGGATVDVDHLPQTIRRAVFAAQSANHLPKPKPPPSLDEILTAVELRMINLALGKAKGDHTAAAAALGINRNRLWRRLKALGLADSATEEPTPPTP